MAKHLNSESESDFEDFSTPPEIREAAAAVAGSLLPTKSRELYEKAYLNFMRWKSAKNISSLSERVFLAYFKDLSFMKTSTLWSLYSTLHAVLKIRHNLNLENFYQLKGFLKKHGENYSPKQAAIFSAKEIEKFSIEAPDLQYLAIKVVCIFGIKDACRSSEIINVTLSDISDYNEMLMIKIPNTKNKKSRQFVIDAEYYNIVKKYMTLRPEETKDNRFFIKYQNGSKRLYRTLISSYFRNYSRRCESMEALKRHGGWNSNTVAERYIDVSMHNTKSTAEMVTRNIHIPSIPFAKDFRNNDTETLFEEIELANDHEKFRHTTIEPPKKKFKSSKTPLTSAIEQNVSVQNTETDSNLNAKNVTFKLFNCSNMNITLKD